MGGTSRDDPQAIDEVIEASFRTGPLDRRFLLSSGVMADPEKETFGERFGRLVDEAGLSVHEVCQIVGWKSDSSYYKARRGDLGSMKIVGLLRLAKRLRVSPYYLAGESENT
jgi:hypothetical protein